MEKITKSADFRNQILSKASEDGEFRTRLLEDPTTVIGGELDVNLPDALEIQVHEDGPNVVNLVLPAKVQLGDSELANISGGVHDHDFDAW